MNNEVLSTNSKLEKQINGWGCWNKVDWLLVAKTYQGLIAYEKMVLLKCLYFAGRKDMM